MGPAASPRSDERPGDTGHFEGPADELDSTADAGESRGGERDPEEGSAGSERSSEADGSGNPEDGVSYYGLIVGLIQKHLNSTESVKANFWERRFRFPVQVI